MLVKNYNSSDLIKKNQNRVIYSNYIIQKQKVEGGCAERISLQSVGTNDASLVIKLVEGARFLTSTERDTILSLNECPVSSTFDASGSDPPPPEPVVYTFEEQTGAPSQSYSRLSVSSDFTTQISTRATDTDGAEGPYISSDSGATWTRKVTGMTFASGAYTLGVCVARSDPDIMYTANRRNFVSVVTSTYDDLYKSTDGGENWSVVSPAQCTWSAIACSYDGDIVLAGNTNGPTGFNTILAYSTDGGANWTVATPTGQFNRVAISSDGTRMYGGGTAGNTLQRSSDTGATWASTNITQTIQALACSSDGLVVLVGTTTKPRLSTDGGVTFTQMADLPTETWSAVAVSEDGTILAAASNSTSRVWISRDTGATWYEQDNSPDINWATQGLDFNSDGSKLAAGPSNAKLQIGTFVP